MSALYCKGASGLTVRVLYWDSSDNVYNGSTFVSYSHASLSSYKQDCTEKTSSGTYYPDSSPPSAWHHATFLNNATDAHIGYFDRYSGVSEVISTALTAIGTAVWATTTRLLTAGTNIVLAKGTGVTGFNDLDAAGVRTAVGLASGNLDAQLSGINSKTTNLPSDPADASVIAGRFDTLDSAIAVVDGVADAIKLKTDGLPSDPADQSLIIAATDTLATLIGTVDTVVDAIKLKTDNLPSDPADASVIAGRFDTLDAAVATVDGVADAVKAKTDNLPSDPADASVIAAAFAVTDGLITTVDGVVDAIKAKTDALPSDPADASDIASSFTDVNNKLDALDLFDHTTDTVIVGTNNDKTGYSLSGGVTVSDKTGFKLASDGLDAISTTRPAGLATNFAQMFVQLYWRFFGRTTRDATTIKTYMADETSVATTQTYTASETDDDVGAAS